MTIRSKLKKQSSKIARSRIQALYTKLYRADRGWLLQINEVHKAKRVYVNNRVNWRKRNLALVKTLFAIISKIDAGLSLPRATKRWLMFQLSNTPTVEKYSHKLPLTSMTLSRYAESISQYQIRRITNRHPNITRRWFLLHASGLSEERMTNIIRQFLEELNEMLTPFEFMFSALPTADLSK
ncbi:TnsD family Tn7-like transposition protein [Paraglaciecola aquimarina]|uniref:TnsD family Tn7-like transposition protein n=1 Tax=Paraglaciecola aquimarina TaxID=1235557 RepID=A0ABU3T0J1_9ALTE|nr:TnsD family Tn7-like transposition protein [Paraglaciecola aquimarina]MDU0355780.1 TnsD family Tn7-like transposition protein [Paraglaciecola aquimarina]